MKYTRVYLIAASVVTILALSSIRLANTGQIEPGRAKSTAGQQKGGRDKRPAGEDRQDDQAIRLGTQLVTVPFNVTDKKNRYINDLSKDDIELFEDNKPQQVFSFERPTPS